jgi:3-vinyl bacteriochlorophyllide hydratase
MYTGALSGASLMYLALAAYATYVVNAGQFLLKLRAARLDYAASQQANLQPLGGNGVAA